MDVNNLHKFSILQPQKEILPLQLSSAYANVFSEQLLNEGEMTHENSPPVNGVQCLFHL